MDDEDSLFGSPPPSPGRSPSPGLALPGRSSTHASGSIVPAVTKNVGTIALPGSQPNSELFLNPLASSLSLPVAPRPPALASSTLNTTYERRQSSSGTATVSRASSPGPSISAPPKPKQQQRKRKKPTDPSITPEALQIPDLDPNTPPPPNFLRNQLALLGAAGLVAGVRPVNIVHHSRGTTPSNPIVIEEEETKQRPRVPVPRPRKDAQDVIGGYLDKSYPAMPSKQEVLASLAKEKDIFPIIRSLIKVTAPPPDGARYQGSTHSARRAGGPTTTTESQSVRERSGPRSEVIGTHATGFPMKKRKLNRVPAGAADWDIPYPFAEDEGPEEYHETWRSERGKQLISQLINLIKAATQKAAMIKYMKHKAHRQARVDKGKAKEDLNKKYEEGPHVNKYYRPTTATYGAPASRRSTPARDSSQNPSRSATPSSTSVAPCSSAATTPGPELTQESNSLDLLLSQLFAMTQAQNIGPPPVQDVVAAPSTNTSGREVGGGGAGTDQGWLDDWMKMLDPSTNMNSDGSFTQPVGGPEDPFPMDFNFPSFDFPTASNVANASSTSVAVLPFSSGSDDSFPIDPELLALSRIGGGLSTSPAPSPMSTAAATSVISATTSATSSTTPTEASWDMDMLDIFTNYTGNDNGMGSLSAGDINRHHQDGGDQRKWGNVMGKVPSVEDATRVDKPEPQPVAQVQEKISTCTSIEEEPSASSSSSLAPALTAAILQLHADQTPVVGAPKARITAEKEDIVRRVKERKALLEVELNKVKLQLWETTIEQGALHHVLGHYQEKNKKGNDLGAGVEVGCDSALS